MRLADMFRHALMSSTDQSSVFFGTVCEFGVPVMIGSTVFVNSQRLSPFANVFRIKATQGYRRDEVVTA